MTITDERSTRHEEQPTGQHLRSSDLKGLFPTSVTPLDGNLEVLEREHVVHIQRLARVGYRVGGMVVNGHAGEVAALDSARRHRMVELARSAAPVGCHVIAGVESRSTRGTIELLKEAEDAGADAALILSPFDYLPRRTMTRTTDAPLRFFTDLVESVGLPLIVSQYPVSAGISYTTETLDRLADIDSVIGVASAVEDLDTYREQYDAVHERIAVLAAGDGSGLMPMLEHGADGALLAIGNVGTADWARVVESCIDGRADQVRALFADRLAPLAEVLSGDLPDRGFSGNAVIKEALVQLGFLSTSRVFGPELDLDEATKKTIAKALATAELLPPGA